MRVSIEEAPGETIIKVPAGEGDVFPGAVGSGQYVLKNKIESEILQGKGQLHIGDQILTEILLIVSVIEAGVDYFSICIQVEQSLWPKDVQLQPGEN